MPVFEFHSGFWLNLHHALYEQARIRQHRPTQRPEPKQAGAPQSFMPDSELTAAEREAWNASLESYENLVAGRDLQFEGDLALIKNRLAELENCADLSGQEEQVCTSGIRQDLVVALERAAPTYRAKWWGEQDRRNRAWISALAPRVQQVGAPVAGKLSLLFHTDWPGTRIRVDVSGYAGPSGSYTSYDPMHVTVSSADGRNQGPAALEVLFYEASHVLALSARDLIARECRTRGKPIPRELWNAMLYYTTIAIARTESAGAGSTPAEALAARGWQRHRTDLDSFWKPFMQSALRGAADPDDLEQAILRIVASL